MAFRVHRIVVRSHHTLLSVGGRLSQLSEAAITAGCKVMRHLIHTWLRPDSGGSVHLTCMATLPKWGKKSPLQRKGEFNLIIRCEEPCQCL